MLYTNLKNLCGIILNASKIKSLVLKNYVDKNGLWRLDFNCAIYITFFFLRFQGNCNNFG